MSSAPAQAGAAVAESQPPPAPEPPIGKLSPLGKVPDWTLLQAKAARLTRADFEKAWREIYAEVNGPPPPWEVSEEALVVPISSGAEPARLPFRKVTDEEEDLPPRVWRRAATLPPLAGRPVLSDLHICLDPGHIGGKWARMEERYLSFREGEAVCEGDLTLLTARVLAERLKALGAVVSLVRDQPEPVTKVRPAELQNTARALLAESGFPTPQVSYEGLVGDAKLLTVQWQSEKLFYRVSEIHARGDRVNDQLKPDLVLCLHLNAEAWGAAETPQFSPQNHLHVLVNGCYSRAELLQQDVRYEMLWRILEGIHEEEIPLATAVVEGVARSTGLPAYVYTTPNARRVGDSPYVYARNLLANRIYRCPVVYLEPFVMNHEETYRRLLAGHYLGRTLIQGRLQTSAIEDYVRGVVDGLTDYYRRKRRP
ncbi:MAG: N-acetylmuramoyl-L-alanine amidase [Prosthecobacter sp.]|nr:N-acetylmuramoyl-L-alanine amidase [Prosthecobacter sp.]